ncbi:hypothetical protein FQZ97_1065910 [compost metagenome]
MEVNIEIKTPQRFLGDGFKVGVEIVALAIFLIERRPPGTELDGQNDYVSRKHCIHIAAFFVADAVFITQQYGKPGWIAFRHVDWNIRKPLGACVNDRFVRVEELRPLARNLAGVKCCIGTGTSYQR